MRVAHREDELENHDRGLDHDLPRILQRRNLLRLVAGTGVAGIGLLTLGACGSGAGTDSAQSGPAPSGGPGGPGGTPPSGAPSGAPGGGGPGGRAGGTASNDTDTSGDPAVTDADDVTGKVPEETAGPYPGDGSNGANVLTQSGVVRTDLRSSFGSGNGTAEGVPLTITMQILDHDADNAPLAGAAVYVWHCNRAGEYSLYSEAVKHENYLRGVAETGTDGTVTFTSIFPACYSGRWPHIHFEVYPSLAKATNGANKIATSQMAMTETAANAVFATDGYEQSVTNFQTVSLASDNVFGDGYDLELPKLTGSPAKGYTLTFACAV